MENFEDFRKKYEFNKYEQTSCLIYEMYIRAEKIKKQDFNIDTSYEHFSDFPRIKDICFYSSNTKAVTLQNIIYNIYPEIYVDAVIWITQYHIHYQLTVIKDNLSKIENQDKKLLKLEDISNYFSDVLQKINPHLNRLFSDDKFFERSMIDELIKYRDKIDDIEKVIEDKISKMSVDFNSVKSSIDNKIEKVSTSYLDYKILINEINKILQNSNIHKKIEKEITYLKIASNCVDNIIGYITDLQQEFKMCLNKDVELLEIDISGFHRNIQNNLNNFSFTLEYLQNEYLNKDEKEFVPQLIENPFNNSYIKITKKYVQDLINNYLFNLNISPNFKRPIYELNKISPLHTLHNINLSLPIEELTSYIQNLKDNYNKVLKTEEKTKYEITYHEKTMNVEKYLTNLESAIKILYIYDYPILKKEAGKDKIDIWDKLEISRSTYYLFKKIATTYIDERKYLELYNSKKIST